MRRGSMDDFVDYLRHQYWDDAWTDLGDDHWRKFNFSSSGDHSKNNNLNVHFDEDDNISSEMKGIVKDAFKYVADILNITVSFRVADGDEGDVNIHKEDWVDAIVGTEFAHAEADLGWFGSAGYYQVNPKILFDEEAFSLSDPVLRNDYVKVFIHELTHLLGLGHLGDYNGELELEDRRFTNDSVGWSIMSYVNPGEGPYSRFEFSGLPATFREADLRALKIHYDIEFSAEEDNTIWGFDGNVSHSYINEIFSVQVDSSYDETGSYRVPALTVVDTGGTDTLNLVSSLRDFDAYNVRNIVDLNPNSYSSILSGKNNLYIFDDSIIENVKTGSGHDDIFGNRYANSIETGLGHDFVEAGAGHDTIDAGEGVDRVWGEAGNDKIWVGDGGFFDGGAGRDKLIVSEINGSNYTLRGGAGSDTLEFDDLTETAGFSLNTDTHQLEAFATGKFLTLDFEEFEQIKGSDFDDKFVMSADPLNNFTRVHGMRGNDEIIIDMGDIIITGGIGDDVFKLLSNDAVVRGGSDNDFFEVNSALSTLNGQRGQDHIHFLNLGHSNVTVDAAAKLYSYDIRLNDLSTDNSGQLSNFEVASVELDLSLTFSGRNIGETVTGGNQADYLSGLGGNDILYGGNDKDKLFGGRGADTLFGERGSDTLNGNSGADRLEGGYSSDYLYGGAGDDTIIAGEGEDWIETHAGNDSVEAGEGNDTVIAGSGVERILGEDGNDLFVVKTGEKIINGGEESDTLKFLGKVDREVDLDITKYDDELRLTVSFVNIENVETQGGSDSVTGNADDNYLNARGGSDTLNGRSGNDTLAGGKGYDSAIFISGTDMYVNLDSGISEGEGTDTLISIENVRTGAGDDFIRGSDVGNVLEAGDGADKLVSQGGNDLLYSGGGDDQLFAGNGNDRVYGGDGFDLLSFDEGVIDVTFSLAVQRAQETNIGSVYAEQVEAVAGTLGNDHISGNTQDNVLKGADGDDTLSGGVGSDTIYGDDGADTFIVISGDGDDQYFGGSGSDWLDFSNAALEVRVNLTRSTQSVGTYGNDQFDSIENIIGGTDDDTLIGNSDKNILNGGKGDDYLDGGLEADTLIGGLGIDTIFGAEGADTLEGGAGEDIFVFKAGNGKDLIVDFSIEEGDIVRISGAEFLEFAEVDGYMSIIYSENGLIGFKNISDISDISSSIELI